jgi:hypothetical protein
MPPPKRKLPPPRRQGLRINGKYVRAEQHPDGTFFIVTQMSGMVVGHRLDKGRGTYPTLKAFGLDFNEVPAVIHMWDTFIEQNKTRK